MGLQYIYPQNQNSGLTDLMRAIVMLKQAQAAKSSVKQDVLGEVMAHLKLGDYETANKLYRKVTSPLGLGFFGKDLSAPDLNADKRYARKRGKVEKKLDEAEAANRLSVKPAVKKEEDPNMIKTPVTFGSLQEDKNYDKTATLSAEQLKVADVIKKNLTLPWADKASVETRVRGARDIARKARLNPDLVTPDLVAYVRGEKKGVASAGPEKEIVPGLKRLFMEGLDFKNKSIQDNYVTFYDNASRLLDKSSPKAQDQIMKDAANAAYVIGSVYHKGDEFRDQFMGQFMRRSTGRTFKPMLFRNLKSGKVKWLYPGDNNLPGNPKEWVQVKTFDQPDWKRPQVGKDDLKDIPE